MTSSSSLGNAPSTPNINVYNLLTDAPLDLNKKWINDDLTTSDRPSFLKRIMCIFKRIFHISNDTPTNSKSKTEIWQEIKGQLEFIDQTALQRAFTNNKQDTLEQNVRAVVSKFFYSDSAKIEDAYRWFHPIWATEKKCYENLQVNAFSSFSDDKVNGKEEISDPFLDSPSPKINIHLIFQEREKQLLEQQQKKSTLLPAETPLPTPNSDFVTPPCPSSTLPIDVPSSSSSPSPSSSSPSQSSSPNQSSPLNTSVSPLETSPSDSDSNLTSPPNSPSANSNNSSETTRTHRKKKKPVKSADILNTTNNNTDLLNLLDKQQLTKDEKVNFLRLFFDDFDNEATNSPLFERIQSEIKTVTAQEVSIFNEVIKNNYKSTEDNSYTRAQNFLNNVLANNS